MAAAARNISAPSRRHPVSTRASFVTERRYPPPGSIPDVLEMLRSEVRFYSEIAQRVGVRVPLCYEAVAGSTGTRLVLEDLTAWQLGADPVAVAPLLAGLHRRFEGQARNRWPWLRPVGAAADLTGERYDKSWPRLAARTDLPWDVRALAHELVGRVADAERTEAGDGPLTLVHGNAALGNIRTGPDGEIAFLDWEDVRESSGAADLAWLLLSSVDPARWHEVIDAYGGSGGLDDAFPAAVGQGFFSLIDLPDGSAEAAGWIQRLQGAAEWMAR